MTNVHIYGIMCLLIKECIMKNYKPQEFAKMLGVTVKTLQRWDRDGQLTANRTPTDRRYYTHSQYVEYMGLNQQIGDINCIFDKCCHKRSLFKRW